MFYVICFFSVVLLFKSSDGLRVGQNDVSTDNTSPPVAQSSANLRTPSLAGNSLSLDNVLSGSKNLTAVMVNATPISNNTIQIIFEANITTNGNSTMLSNASVSKSVLATAVSNSTDTVSTATTTTTTVATATLAPTTTAVPATVTTPNQRKTNIRIIYGAEDTNSINLIKDGVASLFSRDDILNKTSIDLVPYGNATEIKVNTLSAGFLYWHPELSKGNITNVYRCPNGESECESSLIQACAMHVSHNNPKVYLPFIKCMVSDLRVAPEDSSFACSNSTSFMESLRECALGQNGITLQHQLAQIAWSSKSLNVLPTVYINDEYHPFNSTGTHLKGDFTKFVCDAIFADGLMDRDTCENGPQTNSGIITAPFESLLTQPTNPPSKLPPTTNPKTVSKM